MVKQEEGKGGRLVVGVELQEGVEAAALVLNVLGTAGTRQPCLYYERTRTGEVPNYELG